MPKGYWIVAHRRPPDEGKAAAYREIAVPFLKEEQARIVVMGGNAVGKESGKSERVVVIEFPSHAAALAAYESETYQRALKVLEGGAERDFRIVEGLD